MDGQVNPVKAKALREAFKETKSTRMDTTCRTGASVEIRGTLSGGPKDPVLLVIFDGDEDLASVRITPGILKRLGREVGFWKNMKSGALNGTRFGNKM